MSQNVTVRSKADRFMTGKRPEPNDGDIENFYANDPSKFDKIHTFKINLT